MSQLVCVISGNFDGFRGLQGVTRLSGSSSSEMNSHFACCPAHTSEHKALKDCTFLNRRNINVVYLSAPMKQKTSNKYFINTSLNKQLLCICFYCKQRLVQSLLFCELEHILNSLIALSFMLAVQLKLVSAL